MNKLPILIVTPHGGYTIPEELQNITEISKFDLFIAADTCANEIFDFHKTAHTVLNTHISKMFIDLNREPATKIIDNDGLIKRATSMNKKIFIEENFPNNIAIANMVKRYYNPFHEKIQNTIKNNEIRLIIECHTIMAVGGCNEQDADQPRPLVRIQHLVPRKDKTIETCPAQMAACFLEQFKKNFSEEESVEAPFQIATAPSRGYIMNSYSGEVPLMRLDISRGLFLNERYFNYDYLKVDQIRLAYLKEMLWNSIEKLYHKYF